ncbi:hypothetical protein E2N92_12315 [Methanofollis formosanus]|uniref:Yip1 domain-containing protein n=1 Tax=Methanofollis formosanus TaxID=299308 RepID=A0A8G1A3Z2_9EURY|nr:YIP1 family protein [Methanofollis formosanus]QYZ80155.1 hypothetical protein E2N92_12315 [Methanofollis formosanus]
MPADLVERMKGFLTDPVESFKDAKGDDLGEVLKYFVVILAINAVLSGLLVMAGFNLYGDLSGMGIGTGVVAGISMIIWGIVAGLIGLFVIGLIIHLFVVILVGGNGLEQTIKAVAYGATPAMLLGWIPFIGFLAGIWSLVLYVLGIRELHETTTGRAAAAVLLPLVVLFVLGFILLAAVIAFFTLAPVS